MVAYRRGDPLTVTAINRTTRHIRRGDLVAEYVDAQGTWAITTPCKAALRLLRAEVGVAYQNIAPGASGEVVIYGQAQVRC